MYSQKWNCAASFPIFTFMYLCPICTFPRSVHLFCCCEIGRPIVGTYKALQIHKRMNWEWGRAVSFISGVFVSNFRYSVFAVHRTGVKSDGSQGGRFNLPSPTFFYSRLLGRFLKTTWGVFLLLLLGYLLHALQFEGKGDESWGGGGLVNPFAPTRRFTVA